MAKDSGTPAPPIRVGLVSLGCAKNLVDAEIMLGTLAQDGLEITNEASLADVVIINTCAFIDSAQEESVETILESAAVREARHRGQGLVVAGCLPQRFREELPKLLPEVDAFMGVDQVPQITEIIRQAVARRAQRLAPHPHPAKKNSPPRRPVPPPPPVFQVHRRPRYIPDYATPRFRLTPPHTAYVKIAEGCNHPCSFCTIPRIRGPHRSRLQDDILAEARPLLARGVKELNLISQDTTYYGRDLRRSAFGPTVASTVARSTAPGSPMDAESLTTLLPALNALPGRFWVRLLYTHPAHWTDDLIRTIAACPKVARYVDLPLQHIHPVMLERMRRETSQAYLLDLIQRIRAGIPGIALRTTFIVGFPGETEAYFQTLLDFIRETHFERLGVFTYSPEQDTRAAAMAQQISDRVKQRRRREAMALQREIARAQAARQVGQTMLVLVEKEAHARDLRQARIQSWEHGLVRATDTHTEALRGRYWVARGEADAPDIDGRVYVRGHPPAGEFATVRVIGHTDYDLIAEPVEIR